jgi:hypothetical protein
MPPEIAPPVNLFDHSCSTAFAGVPSHFVLSNVGVGVAAHPVAASTTAMRASLIAFPTSIFGG